MGLSYCGFWRCDAGRPASIQPRYCAEHGVLHETVRPLSMAASGLSVVRLKNVHVEACVETVPWLLLDS